MNDLSSMMSVHHRYCDECFAEAERAGDSRDWSSCTALTARFVEAMQAHFTAEEAVLFPAFESVTGITTGPTRMMRMEHTQMRELLEQMLAAANEMDQDTFLGTAETLLVMMEQHNMKEEHILYPMCDQHLQDYDEADFIEQLEDALQGGCLS